MLTLLIGTDWVKNRDAIMDKVAADVASGMGGRVLLVPELISHDTERRLCAAAGDTATLYAEVISFTRMVRAVSDCVGKGLEPCLDNGGRLVAMAATTRQLHSVLKAYASVETKPEFLSDLVATVDEFKQCCVTSADLVKAASMTTGSLAQKLEELALILDTYDAICLHGKRDPADQMNWLLEQMEDSTYAEDRVFYVDGFPDFTEQHRRILEYIIRCSPSVTVSLNCDKPGIDKMAFDNVGLTAKQLQRFAEDNGIPYEIVYIDSEESAAGVICDKLFQGNTSYDPTVACALQVCHAGTIYQECAAAAQQVRALVTNKNRYRDISVVCANMGSYQNTLAMVFRRFGIPLYISGTENILVKPVISAFLTAVDAALGGFESKDVLSYIKSSISPLTQDAADELENYAYSWKIQGSLWSTEWKMHPKGFAMDWYPADHEKLARLNVYREQVAKPLLNLRDTFGKAKNLGEQIRAIYGFMEEVRLSETFGRLADIAESNGDNRSAQVFNQLWEILMSALEQLHDVLGATIWDPDTFTRLLRLLLSQYNIGTIPPVLDAVVAGPANAMRCQQAKHLIVLGANEGCFPAYSAAKGVLSQQERIALRTSLGTLNGDAENRLHGEFYDIYGVFCGARESVYVSAGPGEPSFVFRRLAQLVSSATSIDDDPAIYVGDAVDAGSLLARMEDAETADDLSISDVFESMTEGQNYRLGAVDDENINGIYGDVLHLSPTSITMQAQCRLRFFLQYGIKAREIEQYSINAAAFGTYVHNVLENTSKAVLKQGGFKTVALDKTLELAKKFSDEYIAAHFSDVESVREKYLLNRNWDEVEAIVQELWEEMSQSDFTPSHFELEFGKKSHIPAVPIDNTDIPADLDGKIDRVDIWENDNKHYFRIVDYKTGIDRILDYCNIQNGMGLQMLLYLFALQDVAKDVFGKTSEPAGVLYFPAVMAALKMDGHPDDEEMDAQRESAWVRSSLLLNSDPVLKAMCLDLKKIGVKENDDGTITGDLLTVKEFALLKEYIHKILANLVNDIASGCVDPNPYSRGETDNACHFCPFKAICHPEENGEFRVLAKTDFAKFWGKLVEEMDNDGGKID